MIYYFSLLYAKTLADKLNPDIKANLNGHSSIAIQSRFELGAKSCIFMENERIISLTNLKSVSAFTICRNLIWIKNWICITIFSEKFLSQCKEQTDSKVPSNILLLYKVSSWIWQLRLCKNKLDSQIIL